MARGTKYIEKRYIYDFFTFLCYLPNTSCSFNKDLWSMLGKKKKKNHHHSLMRPRIRTRFTYDRHLFSHYLIRNFTELWFKMLKTLVKKKKIRLYTKRENWIKSIRNQNTNINEECLWLGFIRVHTAKKRIRACRRANRNFQNTKGVTYAWFKYQIKKNIWK